jgi:hypothetical protein
LITNIENILKYYKDDKTNIGLDFILNITWLLANIVAGPSKSIETIVLRSEILKTLYTLNPINHNVS